MRFSTFFLVLAAVVATAYSLKCFECNSKDHPACADPFKEEDARAAGLLIDCSNSNHKYQPEAGGKAPQASFCRKTTQRASLVGMKDEDKRVIRQCGFLNDTRLQPDEDDDKKSLKCYRRVGTFEVELLYCACYAEECNPAARPEASFFALVGIALSALFIRL